MSDMPDKGHCKCKFSSGGVLNKSCAWHNNMARDAARYRWLRDTGDSTWQPLIERAKLEFPHVPVKELASMVDEMIDGAIAPIANGDK